MPYVEIPEVPDTTITGPVPVNTTTSNEDATDDDSEYVTIGAKASKLASVIGSPSTTVPSPVASGEPIVTATTKPIIPDRTTDPTPRPTVQPGFGVLVALLGIGVSAFHIVRRR